MLRTRIDLERYGQQGVFRSDYVLPNLSYLPAKTMNVLRGVLAEIDHHWSDIQLVPSHFPFLVDSNLISELLPHFHSRVHPTEVRDSRGQRRQGFLPMSGGCLQAIAFLRKSVQSYRQLPGGVYSTDFAVSPFEISTTVTGWEDIICINGIDLRSDGDQPRMKGLILDVFANYGLDVDVTEDQWWFKEPATTFRLPDGHLIALTQDYPTSVGNLGITYLDQNNTVQLALAELFYVSQDALLLLADCRATLGL